MKRDSFIFYRSFMESLSCFDDQTRLAVYDALTQYALNGVEPELNGGALGIFRLIKPQIDANNQRYENGLKGGRPKKQDTSEEKPNKNQTKTKIKPNENENENVNENEKDKRKECQTVVDLFNETCVSFSRVVTLSEARKKAIKARLNLYSVDAFKKLFEMAEQSDFLKGKNDRNWIASFDWLIKDANMAKVLDGNYVNRKKKNFENERIYDEAELEKLFENLN